MVGPFIFFDQAGPAEFLTGQGVDVRPHPLIGLGTVTYLFQGDFHHRDSTGADQIIRPGALNWMVAGRGVTHSERTSATARRGPNSLFGIQTWLALPDSHEDVAPSSRKRGYFGKIPLSYRCIYRCVGSSTVWPTTSIATLLRSPRELPPSSNSCASTVIGKRRDGCGQAASLGLRAMLSARRWSGRAPVGISNHHGYARAHCRRPGACG
jgi:hypothetical protein